MIYLLIHIDDMLVATKNKFDIARLKGMLNLIENNMGKDKILAFGVRAKLVENLIKIKVHGI